MALSAFLASQDEVKRESSFHLKKLPISLQKGKNAVCVTNYISFLVSENVELTLAEETYELPDLPILQESNGIMVIESKEMFARGDCVDQLSNEIKK